MKKYFFGGLCTSSTSGKGMCVAICILMFSCLGFSQSGRSVKDSSVTFKKWEVSLDLKPVFRSDQPFKLFIAKNLSERSSIRFGITGLYIGSSNSSTTNESFKDSVLNSSSGSTRGDTLISNGKVSDPQTSFGYNIGLIIGYRKELFLGKLSLYCSTDLGYYRSYSNSSNGTPINFVTGGYSSTVHKTEDIVNNFSLSESLGLRYRINKHISFAVESNITLGYSKYKNYYFVRPINDAGTLNTEGNNFNLNFNHLSGLFLNYHF